MESIFNAIRKKEFNVLVDLLSAQPDIDLNTWHPGAGELISPLFLAALYCNLEAIEYLVSHGADINIKKEDVGGVLDYLVNNTYTDPSLPIFHRPIHAACGHQTRQVIEYLIENGADINIKDESLGTALSYLVRVDTDKIDFSLIESFVARGADIKEAFFFAFEDFKHELLRCLMRAHKKSRYNGSTWETWELETEYYMRLTIGRELDFDILEYFIEAPDLVFQDFSISKQTSAAEALQYIYTMLNQFMEKKSWENALRLILVYLYSFDLTFDNHYSLDGSEAKENGIIETILENLTDFSYVDPKGIKFVDAMFNKYLELELFKQIVGNVGKKLLEAGADRKILNEALNNYLNLDEFDIDIVKQFIEIGVDLNISLNHNGEETPLCDTVYMVSALHGHFELAEEMIAKGANLGCILLSKEMEKMLENNHFLEGRVQFVVEKLIAGGFLKDRNTKMGPRATPFVSLFEYHDCQSVLVKCGLLPKTPRGLTFTHSGVSCCLSWEPAYGIEDFPVTGYLIQSWHIFYERWEKVATIECRETNKFEVSGLKNGDVVKFRVLARNYYGISVPLEDTESPHKVLVLPSPPGKPDHEVMGNDITITWGPPAEGGYRALTEYRVEGGNKGEDWRILGTFVVSYFDKIQWDRKMKIFDFKRLNFNQVRVIAVNNDGESEPSEPSVEI